MKRVRIILIPLMILFSTDCAKEFSNVVIYDEFPRELDLTATIPNWIDNLSADNMLIQDRLLFIVDRHNDRYISIYNIENRELLARYSGKGKGPGEYFFPPRLFRRKNSHGSRLRIFLEDQGRNERSVVDVYKSLSQNSLVYESTIHIPGEIAYAQAIGDSIIARTQVHSREHFLSFYNLADESITQPTPLSPQDIDLEKRYKRGAKMVIGVNPAEDKIVGVFYFQKRLHIYNIDGKLLKVIKHVDKNEIDGLLPLKPDFRKHVSIVFANCILSDKHIIVIYQNRIEGQTNDAQLLVFDYDGNPIVKYNLDHFISAWAMDWDENTFFGFDGENYEFVSYKLGDFE